MTRIIATLTITVLACAVASGGAARDRVGITAFGTYTLASLGYGDQTLASDQPLTTIPFVCKRMHIKVLGAGTCSTSMLWWFFGPTLIRERPISASPQMVGPPSRQ
jgi:hypothetical protein